jgi:hypothetical protein
MKSYGETNTDVQVDLQNSDMDFQKRISSSELFLVICIFYYIYATLYSYTVKHETSTWNVE